MLNFHKSFNHIYTFHRQICAKQICLPTTARKSNYQYIWNKHITAWKMLHTIFALVVRIRKFTCSFSDPSSHLRIKIVRVHFGWCNFKILTVNSIDVICPRSSFAVPATIGSSVFGICPMGHASSSAPSLVLHSKHSETIPQSHKSAFRDGVNSSTIVVSNQGIFAVFSWNGSTFGVAIATSVFNCESNEMIMK